MKSPREVVWRLCGRRVASIMRDLSFVCLSPLLRRSKVARTPRSDCFGGVFARADRAVCAGVAESAVSSGPGDSWACSQSEIISAGAAVTSIAWSSDSVTVARPVLHMSTARFLTFAPAGWNYTRVSACRNESELSDASCFRIAPATTGMSQTGWFDCSSRADRDAGDRCDGRNRFYVTTVMTELSALFHNFLPSTAGGVTVVSRLTQAGVLKQPGRPIGLTGLQ